MFRLGLTREHRKSNTPGSAVKCAVTTSFACDKFLVAPLLSPTQPMAGQIRSGWASLWRPIFHKLDTAGFGKIAVDIRRIF